MKILFLDNVNDSIGMFFRRKRAKVQNIDAECLYKKRNIFQKLLFGLGVYLFSPILYLTYGGWKNRLKDYDLFIVSSRRPSKYAIKYIKKKTNKRVIVWYWNIVTRRELDPEYCKKLGCETWSFDREDCIKYKMNFGDTYYFPISGMSDVGEDYDLCYIGMDKKGRIDMLNKFQTYMYSRGLKYKFILTKSPTEKSKKEYQYSERIAYEKVLEYISKSRAILDLNLENQTGMTLRPLEANFMKKKLITNNKNIVNYLAYGKENTFIIGEDNLEQLEEFIKKPYVEVDPEINKHYYFENWLKRIIKGEISECL